MQKIFFYFLLPCLGLCAATQAQVSLDNQNPPRTAAILDLNMPAGNNRGVLFPLIALKDSVDRTAIPSPDDYLLVFTPYTSKSPQAGLNYWLDNRWHHLLNQTDMNKLRMSEMHLAQAVLHAKLKEPEKNRHVTDPDAKNPYKFPLNQVVFDSQEAYDKTAYEYVIPHTGFYEISCDVEVQDAMSNYLQCFLQKRDSVVSELVYKTARGKNISIIYNGTFNEGDVVYASIAVGGFWDTSLFRVRNASLTIVMF